MNGYAMYTDAGNSAVEAIVKLAIAQNLSWSVTDKLLQALSQDERFSEATDTAVRETVYAACDFS
jgi:predicted transcriptional regulator